MSTSVGSSREIRRSVAERFVRDSFMNVTKDFPFLSSAEKIVSRPVMNRILYKGDLLADALVSNENVMGLIVYRKELQSRFHQERKDNFEIKKIILQSSDSSSKDYKQKLLDRVIELAKEKFANGILMTIEDSSNLLNFFLEKKFIIVKTWEKTKMFPKEHLIQYVFPSSKESNMYTNINNGVSSQINRGSSDAREMIATSGKRKQRDDESEVFIPNKSANTSVKIHNLPMKGTIYFEYIMNGKKKFEGRVCGPACRLMHVGDCLQLFDNREGWGIICEIISKDTYKDFKDMLEAKGVLPLLPQLEDKSKWMTKDQLLQEGIRVYQSFPGSNRVRHYGAAAIGVKFIRKI